MAMTDDPSRKGGSITSHSRPASPGPPLSSSSDYASAPRCPVVSAPTSPSTSNGINDTSFQVPRHNFSSNLGLSNIRLNPSVKSPIPRTSQEHCSQSSTSLRASESVSNGQSHHVTETHHITKDYDERTGAKTINRYEFLETIGRGVHGKVKLAKDTQTGELVAIKIVNRITRKRLGRWDPMEAENKIRREIAIMKKCVHPNVVALREVMDDPNSKKIYLGTCVL
jgi:hypothetical protein